MKWKLEFTSSTLSALSRMGKIHRRFVLDGIRTHLIENDPSEVARNKFPLKRPSQHAERELRLENWRVFYTIVDDDGLVIINLIGEKRGNKLFIEDEEFEL